MFQPLIPELQVPVFFRERPISVPGDLRPAWRISVIVLLLHRCCRQGKSSIWRLHVLSWAIRNIEVANALLLALEGKASVDTVLVRIEPALNRTVDYAIGEGLLRRQTSDRVELTADGKEFAEAILKDSIVLGYEKQFIEKIRFSVTEDFVKKMFEQGGMG